MQRLNWAALVRQIDRHRAGAALFFKPVCVIAAIDLAEEGRIDPDNIDAPAVVDRFADYITPFFRDRGADGYQPLWHLTNDRLWTFFDGKNVLNSKTFPHGKPGSKARLFAKFDRLAIHEDLKTLWSSPQDRRALRDSMLVMLAESGSDSRRLVAPLFNPQHLLNRHLWPTDAVLNAYFKNLRDQPHLFEEGAFDDAWPRADGAADASRSLPDVDSNLLASLPPAPEALENVTSPIDYVWSEARIVVGPNSASLPVFPYASAERDHAQRLEACAVRAAELLQDLGRHAWQIRDDYEIELRRYLERLPSSAGPGNILLADAAARTLRDMFAAEDFLPAPFAARLKTMLQQHIGLRPFYPEIGDFYRSVKTGRIDEPLPLDAISDVISVVQTQTPTVFDESVSRAIDDASSVEPEFTSFEHEVARDDSISPPPDPLGELNPDMAHDFQVAAVINRLWKVFKSGEDAHAATEAWIATYRSLIGPMKQILAWLHQFLGR